MKQTVKSKITIAKVRLATGLVLHTYLTADPNEKRWAVQLFQTLKPISRGGRGVFNATLKVFLGSAPKSVICDSLEAKRFPKPGV